MPLFADGSRKIRNNLLKVQSGEEPKLVKVGSFSDNQLSVINQRRKVHGWAPLDGLMLFRGKHVYQSRCVEDGYSIDEVLIQIENACAHNSLAVCERASALLVSALKRVDATGRSITDEAVFECTSRYPAAELFSVIPKGDGKVPHTKRKDPSRRGPFMTSSQ